MSETKAPPRPRQITMAVAMSVVGSLLLVVSLFDTLGRLRTPETRESVGRFLAEPPGSSFDFSTAQVIDAMRVLAMVSGALAAMLLVFAIFVLQRHQGARIGYTVAAVLLLLTVPVAGLMPVVLVAAAALIWSRPGRDWYAGRTPDPAPRPAAGRQLTEQGPPPSQVPFGGSGRGGAHAAGSEPAPPLPSAPQHPDAQYGPQYGPQYGSQSAPQDPWGAQPPAAYPQQYYGPSRTQPGRDPERRPVTVTIAAGLTWLGAGLVAAVMLLFMIVLASDSDVFIDEFEKAAQDTQMVLSRDEMLAVGWGVALFFLVWSLIAMVLAALAFRRSNPARITLAVSAAMAVLLSLLLILSIVSGLTLLMAGAALVLLFTGGANEWYSRRNQGYPGPWDQGSRHGYPGHPGYGYGQQQPQPPEQQQPQAPEQQHQPPEQQQPPVSGRQKPW
jgi:hypothetical protein